MENIVLKTDTIPSRDQILNLYANVGWTAYTKDPDLLERAMAKSLKLWTLWDDDQVIGLGRVVGDGESIIYIQDLLVLDNYQKMGLGTRLIQAILEEYKSIRQIVLLTDNTSKNIDFYKKNGLVEVSTYDCMAFIR